MTTLFLPVFLNILNTLALPLEKPKGRYYNFYILFITLFLTALTVTSLSHILKKAYFVSNPMNAVLHILVYIVINVLNIAAVAQEGYFRNKQVEELLKIIDEIRLFINKKKRDQQVLEKRLLKLQKFDFILMHATLVPWLLFLSFWVWYCTNFKMVLVYTPVYFNHYMTSVIVMKMMFLLQFIKYLICECNKLLYKALTEKNNFSIYELKLFMKKYDKLIDAIKLFNEAFGLQILGTVIVTPLVIVQAFFFNLSQIAFPSVIRTIVVNVATLVKFTLFLVLSFMIATPSKRIAKEFQNTRRICNAFRVRSNRKVQRALELLSLHLENRKTNISAAGFFDADYTIVLNILVSAVSYVIVFLQIDAKLPRHS